MNIRFSDLENEYYSSSEYSFTEIDIDENLSELSSEFYPIDDTNIEDHYYSSGNEQDLNEMLGVDREWSDILIEDI